MSVNDLEKEKRTFKRKVSQMGNSLGISIPSEIIKEKNITQNDEFEWTINDEGDVLAKRIKKTEIEDEVLKVFSDILSEDAELLWELRDK